MWQFVVLPQWVFISSLVILRGYFLVLFPMEELDSEEIYDDYPADYHAKLRQDADQAGLFGHDQTKTIDDGRHRDESANGAQPFRH